MQVISHTIKTHEELPIVPAVAPGSTVQLTQADYHLIKNESDYNTYVDSLCKEGYKQNATISAYNWIGTIVKIMSFKEYQEAKFYTRKEHPDILICCKENSVTPLGCGYSKTEVTLIRTI